MIYLMGKHPHSIQTCASRASRGHSVVPLGDG